MTVKISDRLLALASLVGEKNVLADVGTDHGYVPIYLIQTQKIESAIAMDINAGPLERAAEHIACAGLGDRIETRLSDGVACLRCGEADSILIAGMGGALIMRIIADGEPVIRSAKELILQPQSQISIVRRYLYENGYRTAEEDIVFEDGKYYPMMRVIPDGGPDMQPEEISGETKELYFRYGRMLLCNRHPVLLEYLKWERSIYAAIHDKLEGRDVSDDVRKNEVCDILDYNRRAMEYYK
jgi:tRNA (adenine22-N1)-methyltransferase